MGVIDRPAPTSRRALAPVRRRAPCDPRAPSAIAAARPADAAPTIATSAGDRDHGRRRRGGGRKHQWFSRVVGIGRASAPAHKPMNVGSRPRRNSTTICRRAAVRHQFDQLRRSASTQARPSGFGAPGRIVASSSGGRVARCSAGHSSSRRYRLVQRRRPDAGEHGERLRDAARSAALAGARSASNAAMEAATRECGRIAQRQQPQAARTEQHRRRNGIGLHHRGHGVRDFLAGVAQDSPQRLIVPASARASRSPEEVREEARTRGSRAPRRSSAAPATAPTAVRPGRVPPRAARAQVGAQRGISLATSRRGEHGLDADHLGGEAGGARPPTAARGVSKLRTRSSRCRARRRAPELQRHRGLDVERAPASPVKRPVRSGP